MMKQNDKINQAKSFFKKSKMNKALAECLTKTEKKVEGKHKLLLPEI